jgi:hypothetical protein
MPVSASGLAVSAAMQLLFKLNAANLQLTTDQPFTKLFGGTNYMPIAIIARQRSGAASVACVGGIYDGAAKSGNIVAAAATNWVTLAAAAPVVVPVANLLQTALLSATPILSLTTGSTAACTADFYIFGVDIS